MQESFQEKRRANALRSNPTWVLRAVALLVVIGVSVALFQSLRGTRPKAPVVATTVGGGAPAPSSTASPAEPGSGYAPTDPRADKLESVIFESFSASGKKGVELEAKDVSGRETDRRFLDTVRPENLSRLDEVAALVLASEGEPAILKRLDDGTLLEAVERLPAPAFEIAREQRSLETAFKWQALAGPALPRVIDYEIYRRNSPDEFTKSSLARLLKLDDRLAVTRLASLKTGVRAPLLELDDPSLIKLGRAFGEGELASLSGYLTGLESSARQRLLIAVVEAPAKLVNVTPQAVREAILTSHDQAAALGVMLRADSIFDFFVFRNDIVLVKDGKISPRILWARYPVALSLFAGVALVLLMLLRRLLFGRRPQIIIQTPKK